MGGKSEFDALDEEHTEEAIAERLAAATRHSYLGDFVLGGVDGAVTTFAVVSGGCWRRAAFWGCGCSRVRERAGGRIQYGGWELSFDEIGA